jgi:hypothetical protein
MPIRWSRRLAGCCAIELLLVAAPSFEYQAGTASIGQAMALALEDRGGNRLVIAQADFPVTREIADFVAAKLVYQYGLNREAMVLIGRAGQTPSPQDLATAMAAALGKMEPAVVRFADGTVSVAAADGQCRATVGGSLRLAGCAAGELVRSPLRLAFRMVEPAHGLEHRGELAPAYAVQAVALGRQAAILALGGEIAPGRFRAPGRIVIGLANDVMTLPDDPGMDQAVRKVLARVGR